MLDSISKVHGLMFACVGWSNRFAVTQPISKEMNLDPIDLQDGPYWIFLLQMYNNTTSSWLLFIDKWWVKGLSKSFSTLYSSCCTIHNLRHMLWPKFSILVVIVCQTNTYQAYYHKHASAVAQCRPVRITLITHIEWYKTAFKTTVVAYIDNPILWLWININ